MACIKSCCIARNLEEDKFVLVHVGGPRHDWDGPTGTAYAFSNRSSMYTNTSSSSSSDIDQSSDECSDGRSTPETPASEAPSFSESVINTCICDFKAKCQACITVFEVVYRIVRDNLWSDYETDASLQIKDKLPDASTFYKAPELVSMIVREMVHIKSSGNLSSTQRNNRLRKGFVLLYKVYNTFACDNLNKVDGGHPPTLDNVHNKNVILLFNYAPIFLGIFASHVQEADGETNAKFVRLVHWYLYRTMMGKKSELKQRHTRLSNDILNRLIKFFIQHPNLMIVDQAFCLSVFFQSGQSTLYPSSFFTSDPALGKSYRNFFSRAITIESLYSALAAAVKTNTESASPNKIATELHVNLIMASMELYSEGNDQFTKSSVCQELVSCLAGALASGKGTRDRFKQRLAQMFDEIFLMCFKRLDKKGQTKFIYKLLPLFVTPGAVGAYIYHTWGADYNVVTRQDVVPGGTNPPLIAAIAYFLHERHNKLQKFQLEFATFTLTWEDSETVLEVLGSTGEIYHILVEVYENRDRLYEEVGRASAKVRDEHMLAVTVIDVLADWDKIASKAKRLLLLK